MAWGPTCHESRTTSGGVLAASVHRAASERAVSGKPAVPTRHMRALTRSGRCDRTRAGTVLLGTTPHAARAPICCSLATRLLPAVCSLTWTSHETPTTQHHGRAVLPCQGAAPEAAAVMVAPRGGRGRRTVSRGHVTLCGACN
eukprot:1937899-Prymnesium_polylepis.1